MSPSRTAAATPGSYSETVEWVRPHQRGLANAIYVPKTYIYDDKSPKVRVP